ALQKYCDQQGGMDCSGFASVAYGYQKIDNEGYDATVFRTRGVERTRIEDIRAGDAIVWLKDDHIALIDSVTGPFDTSPALRCMVAESTVGMVTPTGPGVQYSEYLFDSDPSSNQARKYLCYRPNTKAAGGYTKLGADKITVRGNP